jgi:glyoxylase I family protein
MLEIQTIHHVSVPITDLERSRRFYSDVLGLTEIPRPAFSFAGAWYRAGDRDLHLIVGERSTFREGKGIDSHDVHFAIRVRSYRGAIAHLEALGYGPDTMRVNPAGTAGFPQIYVLDPDRNVVEINAERDDGP